MEKNKAGVWEEVEVGLDMGTCVGTLNRVVGKDVGEIGK